VRKNPRTRLFRLACVVVARIRTTYEETPLSAAHEWPELHEFVRRGSRNYVSISVTEEYIAINEGALSHTIWHGQLSRLSRLCKT